MSALLGRVLATDQFVSISDAARQSGLYILGKPRVGKSWLIVNLILQDIENGHGVFFLDPHGDATNDLIYRLSFEDMKKPILVLNPENKDSVFGINPLECSDIEDVRLRHDAYTKTKGIFDKLWQNTFEEKPWLQLILQNTIYAFIESQGYTLADFPLFFRDKEFRYFIFGNMRHNRDVLNYWLISFRGKEKRDQDAQLEAAQTRAEIMLAHPYVRDILGQSKSTLDFAKLIAEKRIILLKLSSSLSNEARQIIGTIIISELLTAARKRGEDRSQFCIFVDEFQNYASFEDFSTLITQAPKYGIATTIAHHERYGQLNQDAGIIGATSAIANKVLFQITPRDAHELAPEFAEKPPVETRFEDSFVISKTPFWDLLRGHSNPQVCIFAEKYLFPIKERLEDIRGELEADRLIRMEYLDDASLLRVGDQLERTYTPNVLSGLLGDASAAIQNAKSHTEKMQIANEEAQILRLLIRSLNKLLIAVMEDKLSPYSVEFKRALIEQAKFMSIIDLFKPVFEIHLLIKYGEDYHDDLLKATSASESERSGACYRFAKQHTMIFPEPVAAMDRGINQLTVDLEANDIERMEEVIKRRCLEGFGIYGKPVPLTRFPYLERWEELQHNIKAFVAPLRDLKEVCILLEKPENRIKVRSGQYMEKEVPSRTEIDMVNQVVRELTGLEKYTAYAKLLSWTGKIQTLKLRPVPEWSANWLGPITGGWNFALLDWASEPYLKKRKEIDGEISARQEGWKPADTGEPPPVHS